MPYPVTTPSLMLCDGLVESLLAAWQPKAPSGAERQYFKRITDEEELFSFTASTRLTPGERRVIVMPLDYDNRYAAIGEDLFTHTTQTVIAERFDGDGDPDREWIDRRVDFVYDFIVQGFDFRAPPAWNTKLRTTSADVQIFDVAKLLTGGHLFYSLVENIFEEYRDA